MLAFPAGVVMARMSTRSTSPWPWRRIFPTAAQCWMVRSGMPSCAAAYGTRMGKVLGAATRIIAMRLAGSIGQRSLHQAHWMWVGEIWLSGSRGSGPE